MAEKEYIEKSEIIRHLMGESISKYPSTFVTGLCVAADEIIHFPVADVVEVVRCKDCRYFDVITDCCTNELGMHSCYADGFCSYGERKE